MISEPNATTPLLEQDNYAQIGNDENLRALISPANSQTNDRRIDLKKCIAMIILLLVNGLERFAFYGLLCNFMLYLNKKPLYWKSLDANLMTLIFIGITFFTGILGGWVADSLLGKYATVCFSFVLYIIGYAVYPLLAFDNSAIPNFCHYGSNLTSISFYPILDPNISLKYKVREDIADEPCSWIIIISIVLIGIGSGSVKTNIGPFGADQVASNGQSMVFKYFNWLYWSINFGSLCSLSALAYIQQNKNFFIGYIIPFGSLLAAFSIFFIAKPCYVARETDGSVLTNIVKVIIGAFETSRQKSKAFKQRRKRSASDTVNKDNDLYDAKSIESDDFEYGSTDTKLDSFLDNAKMRYGGVFDDNVVEDVKSLRSMFVLFILLIPYWIIYFQIETTFLMQGLHMKLFNTDSTSKNRFMIPAAWLSLSNQIIIIIMVPLMDKIVYPCIKRKTGYEICTKTRIRIGMFLAILSIICAGVIETIRRNIAVSSSNGLSNLIPQTIDNTTYYAANFSILWQIPQYTLVGMSEVFCSIGGLYYAYAAAPKSMQSLVMGFFYSFMGIGSLISSGILYAFNSIIYSSEIPDDINCSDCHLDYYFYFLGIVEFLAICIFLLLDKHYKITQHNVNSPAVSPCENGNVRPRIRFNYNTINDPMVDN